MQGGAPSSYRIRIEYREPTFELHSGQRDKPFYWTYQVTAHSEEEATAFAVREFRATTRASGVGWIRRIVGIEVLPS